MLSKKKEIKFAILMITLILTVSAAYALTPIGQVVPDGKGFVKIGSGWNELQGVSPVVSGGEFKTLDGKLSMLFKDGVRLEIGEMSEVSPVGTFGKYTVQLKKGKMSFVVPKESSLTIKTRDFEIEVQKNMTDQKIEKVSYAERKTIGGIYYDGNKTRVAAISGTVFMKDSKSSQIVKVYEGEAVEISNKDGKMLVTQLAGSSAGAAFASAGAAGAADAEAVAAVSAMSTLVDASTVRILRDQYETEETASQTEY